MGLFYRNYLAYYIRIYAAIVRAKFLVIKKSPINMWMAFLLQIFYYIAQFMFWAGVLNVTDDMQWNKTSVMFGFIVTLAFVDNLYLLVFGPGSYVVMTKVKELNLDLNLIRPLHPLASFVFFEVNLVHLPALILSAFGLVYYYYAFDINTILIAKHLISMLLGVCVLNGISFIYRLSSFWTLAIVNVRNSNPSFKIMVRPLDAFSGKVKMILLTIFPALFITGVPAAVLQADLGWWWILYGFLACCSLWVCVVFMWSVGVKRYAITAQ